MRKLTRKQKEILSLGRIIAGVLVFVSWGENVKESLAAQMVMGASERL